MAIHNYFVLGCIILAASSSTMAVTSADIPDADLIIFQKHFKQVAETAKYTCDNYEAECTKSNGKRIQTICRALAKKYTCDNATDLQGTKDLLKEMEKFTPDFVDVSLPDLRAAEEQKRRYSRCKKSNRQENLIFT